MGKARMLGPFQATVLCAIHSLQDEAYGVTIRRTVAQATNRDVSIGALYTTLDRLEAQGAIRSWLGEPTKERGGKAKRFYRVEALGVQQLAEAVDQGRKLIILSVAPGAVK
jgi:DNA-binding PadR family transcriptional regulator